MSEFAYRNSCIVQAWKNASPDIRRQVMDYKKLKDMSLEELEGLESDNDEETGKRSAFKSV
jgi:hypothetical protein